MAGPGPRFAVEALQTDDVLLVLVLRGELDIQTVGLLRDAMSKRPPQAALVLDLRGVSFMDSSGLVEVLRAYAASRQAPSWRFAVVPGPPSLRRMFEISGVVELVPFVADPDDVLL